MYLQEQVVAVKRQEMLAHAEHARLVRRARPNRITAAHLGRRYSRATNQKDVIDAKPAMAHIGASLREGESPC
jgi:hypothetical protein